MTTTTQYPVVTQTKMTSDIFFELINLSENEIQSSHSQFWQMNGSLIFQEIEFENSIEFKGGFTCNYELTFVSCKFKSFHIIKAVFKKSLEFEHCEISIFKLEKEATFSNQINIVKKSRIKTFQINGGLFKDKVYLDDSMIISQFLIKGDCIFEETLILTKNIFQSDVKILGGTFKKKLVLDNSEFKAGLTFNNVNLEQPITFFNQKFEDSELHFDGGNFSAVIIQGGSFDSIIFRGGNFESIIISDSIKIIRELIFILNSNIKINYMSIDFTDINCKTYKFSTTDYNIDKRLIGEGRINEICLNGILAKDVYCEFVNFTTPSTIDFHNLTNFGNIYFKDIRPLPNQKITNENVFRLFNTDLGKTTFMGSDFSNLYLDFQSSKITESFISDSILPREPLKKQLIDLSMEEKTLLFNQQRSAFSQIKKIYENRGDTVTALEYYAKEMDILSKNPSICCSELINLTLSKFSTNHGTNWWWGLLSTIVASSILFFLFCLSINIYPSFTREGLQYFQDTSLPTYFEFLNPLHKSKEIVSNLLQLEKDINPSISGLTSFTDFMSKIIITYCQFQLVQAFRKHGKK